MTFGENSSVCLEEIQKAAEIHLLSLSPAFLTDHKRELTWANTFPDALAIVGCWRRAASKDSHRAEPICRSGGEQTKPARSDGWGRNPPPPFSVSYSPSLWPTPSPSAVMRRDVAAFLTSARKQGSVATAACWANPRPLAHVWGVSASTTHRRVSVFWRKKTPQFEKWVEGNQKLVSELVRTSATFCAKARTFQSQVAGKVFSDGKTSLEVCLDSDLRLTLIMTFGQRWTCRAQRISKWAIKRKKRWNLLLSGALCNLPAVSSCYIQLKIPDDGIIQTFNDLVSKLLLLDAAKVELWRFLITCWLAICYLVA